MIHCTELLLVFVTVALVLDSAESFERRLCRTVPNSVISVTHTEKLTVCHDVNVLHSYIYRCTETNIKYSFLCIKCYHESNWVLFYDSAYVECKDKLNYYIR